MVQPWSDPWRFEDLPSYLVDPAGPREPRRVRQPGAAGEPGDTGHPGGGGLQRLARSLAYLSGPTPLAGRPSPGGGGSAGPAVPFGGQSPRLSPVFERVVDLHRGSLPATLEAWWSARARAGAVTVQHRLQLRRPERQGTGGWKIQGRVRRLTTLHWVPVQIDLWPVHEDLTRLTMSPEGHVLASSRYFRLGHYVLDRLSEELAGISLATELTTL